MVQFLRFLAKLIVAGFIITASCVAKPNVHIIATGGTIAGISNRTGYTAGKVDINKLISSINLPSDLANLTYEQFVNIGSQDMNQKIWIALSKRVDTVLDSVDAVVITHGTDTMEETAAFLELTLHSNKPVILTGAMIPSYMPDSDGPSNLLGAIKNAANIDSGVYCYMDGRLLSPFETIKTNTISKDSFKSRRKISNIFTKFDVSKIDSLPEVGIIYCYGGKRFYRIWI